MLYLNIQIHRFGVPILRGFDERLEHFPPERSDSAQNLTPGQFPRSRILHRDQNLRKSYFDYLFVALNAFKWLRVLKESGIYVFYGYVGL